MSKPDKPYWIVSITLDGGAMTYEGIHVQRLPEADADLRIPYVQIQADDEIGAFHEAQKILRRLGFSVPA